MRDSDEQAMLLGSLIGLSLATVGVVALAVWWFRDASPAPRS